MSRARRLALVLGIALAVVVAVFIWTQVVDPRLPREEAARQLRERLGVEWTFVCTPASNDGTISGMDDVDYFCQPSRAAETGYWVGTDGSRIVAIQPSG